MILRSPAGDKNGDISLHLTWTPFPLDGESRDRGAREPIKPITPTFVLPRQGEGIRALPPVGSFISRPVAQPQTQISKEHTKATKVSEIDTLDYLNFVLPSALLRACFATFGCNMFLAAVPLGAGGLFFHSELSLSFTQRGGIGDFVQRNLACDIHGFSKILDDDSKPVLRNRSVRAEDAY
jgi:hypothetical protein